MYRMVPLVCLIVIALAGCSSGSGGNSSPPIPAAAPTDLSTRIHGYGKIRLNWTDNGLYENHFHIERSLDGIDYMPIARVPGDQEEYIDSGLSAGRYYYRVNASNSVGYTEYTNESTLELWNVNSCLDTPVTGEAELSGKFFEMPITGLSYLTPSHASFVDNGNYYFGTDSHTDFYLGYTYVGTVLNAPYIRYKDLAISLGAKNYRDPIAVNLLRLLQTVDSDDDPFNGIQIPCDISSLPYREIDFTLDERGFAEQSGMAELTGWKPMVSSLAASQRFTQILNAYYAGTYSMEMIFYLDGIIPVSANFTMIIDAEGVMTMGIFEQPTVSEFSAESGGFLIAYLADLSPILRLFILSEIFGWGFTLEDLPQYYPYAFTVVGAIRPDHTLGGEAKLHMIGDSVSAAILGARN